MTNLRRLVVAFAAIIASCCGFVGLPASVTVSFVGSSFCAYSCRHPGATCSPVKRSRASTPKGQIGGLSMYDQVGPQFAFKLLGEGYTYIDVRADYEFEQGRPAGATNIPAFFSTAQGMMVNGDFVKQVAEKFPDKSSKIVLGCQMGSRSAKAAEWLEDAGYDALVNVEGGFGAWARDDSLPVEV